MQPVDVSSYTCVLASSVLLTFYGCTVLNIVPLWYLVRLYSQPEAEMLRYFSLPGLFFSLPLHENDASKSFPWGYRLPPSNCSLGK